MPDQRLAAHQGNMEGLMLAHEFQDTFDQSVTAQVVQVAQVTSPPKCVSP